VATDWGGPKERSAFRSVRFAQFRSNNFPSNSKRDLLLNPERYRSMFDGEGKASFPRRSLIGLNGKGPLETVAEKSVAWGWFLGGRTDSGPATSRSGWRNRLAAAV